MNITLSADESLIRSTRQYARKKHTTLNALLRQYMEEVTGVHHAAYAADEFRQLASEQPGASEAGYVFRREEAHRR